MLLLKKICEVLKQRNISYALVGGYAVALHGAPRGTIDIDFILPFEEQVFIAAENALQSLGFQPRLPITAQEVFQFREHYIQKKNLIAWSFFNPSNPIEIVDIILTTDLNKCNTVNKKINEITIKVIAKKDLIRMKKNSAREQDLLDIKALEKLR